MSLLNSLFDVQSVDNPMALAALAQVLPVSGGAVTLNANGTPQPGSIPPGAIVTMDSSGNAVLASTLDISASNANKQLVWVTIDGNTDYSGSFVQKLTVLHGGMTIMTDQFNAGAYVPGSQVTFASGKISLVTTPATQQVIGFVGPAGLDTVNNVLQVILPQGCGI